MSPTPHLPLDALADLLVGEGSEADVDHLAGCAECSARLAELDDAQAPVTAVLSAYAATPVPAPPEDLGARLAAALTGLRPDAAAVDRDPVLGAAAGDDDEDGAPGPAAPREPHPGAESAAAPTSGEARAATVIPLQPRRPRRPRGRAVLGVAAAAAGLLAVVGLGVAVSRTSGGSDDAASTTAGGAARSLPESAAGDAAGTPSLASLQPLATGTDYRRDPTALAAALPALLAGGQRAAAPRTASSPHLGEAPAGTGASTAPSFGDAQGSSGSGAALSAPAPAAAQVGDGLTRLRDPEALQRCLAAVDPSGGSPLAVDYAGFEGRPAVLLVLAGSRAATVEVVAVGPACAPGSADELYRTELARPQ